mgnify:CR=1 FL=1
MQERKPFWAESYKAKSQALYEFNQAIEAIKGDIPELESSSWYKQELEARNLNGPTPLIDGLIISRGLDETREELAAKIIAKADAYAIAYAKALGEYQAKLND